MTSDINYEELYIEINKLLKDVCSFLTTEVQNGTLSPAAKNEAEKLVSRSKEKVEAISTITGLQENFPASYPYLQMQRPCLVEEPLSEYVDAEGSNHYEIEEYEESYTQIENGIEPLSLPSFSSTINEDYCPYTEASFCMIQPNAIKHGPLDRKERYFLLDQKKHYMAGLIGYWLLIFPYNKKETKPSLVINLMDYKALAVSQRKEPTFQIIADNRKTHEFIARTAKDVEQWIVAINCKKQVRINIRNLPDIPQITPSPSEDYTDLTGNISNNNSTEKAPVGNDEGEIYESIDDVKKHAFKPVEPVIEDENTPQLPPRKKIIIIPNLNKSFATATYFNVDKSEDGTKTEDYEEENNYDPVQSLPDEEDDTYVEPKEAVNIPVLNHFNRIEVNSDYDDEENNYDSVDISHREDEELVDYDEIRPMPEKKETVQMRIEKPTERSKSIMKLVKQNYEEEEELVDYDELKPMPEKNPKGTPMKIEKPVERPKSITKPCEEEEELVDYDELKFTPEDFPKRNTKEKTEMKIEKPLERSKSITKPAVTSPKPKLMAKQEKKLSFSKNKEIKSNISNAENNKKIHNIIQQMELR